VLFVGHRNRQRVTEIRSVRTGGIRLSDNSDRYRIYQYRNKQKSYGICVKTSHPTLFLGFFQITQPYDPQIHSEHVHAVYIFAAADDQYKFIKNSVSDKKHVICEKPGFLKLSEYISGAKQSRAQNTKLVINLNRRYEPFVGEATKWVENISDDVTMELFSSTVEKEEDVRKVLHSVMINEMDLSVYLSWPFVSAELSNISLVDNKLHVTLTFLKGDGRYVTSNIIYLQNHSTSVTINGKTFGNDQKNVSDDPNLIGYKGVFTEFYQTIKFDKHVVSDVSHPTLYWTYKLLEEALTRSASLKFL